MTLAESMDTISHMLDRIDRDPEIPTATTLPLPIQKFARGMEDRFDITINNLHDTADLLEKQANTLRERADYLVGQREIAQRVRDAVLYERQCHEEVVRLALVSTQPREG